MRRASAAYGSGVWFAVEVHMHAKDRIWRCIDDPTVGRHQTLLDALYRLLVAIEAAGPALAHSVDRCLDVTSAAIRDGSAASIARAHAIVDDLASALTLGEEPMPMSWRA
jgi:hypothetical protein